MSFFDRVIAAQFNGCIVAPSTVHRSFPFNGYLLARNAIKYCLAGPVQCTAHGLQLVPVLCKHCHSCGDIVVRYIVSASGGVCAAENRIVRYGHFAGTVGLDHTAEGGAALNGQHAIDKQVAAFVQIFIRICRLPAFFHLVELVCNKQRFSAGNLGFRAFVDRYRCAGQKHRIRSNREAPFRLLYLNIIRNCKRQIRRFDCCTGYRHLHRLEGHIAVEGKCRLSDRYIRHGCCGSRIIRNFHTGRVAQLEQILVSLADRCDIRLQLNATCIEHAVAIQRAIAADLQIALDVHDRVTVERAAVGARAVRCDRSAMVVRDYEGLIYRAVGIDLAAGDIAAVRQDRAFAHVDGGVSLHHDLAVRAIGAAGHGMVARKRTAHNQLCAVRQRQLCTVQRQGVGCIRSRRGNAGYMRAGFFVGIGMLRVRAVDGLLAGCVWQQQGHIGRNGHVVILCPILQQHYDIAHAIPGSFCGRVQSFVIVVADLRHRVEAQLEVCLQGHISRKREAVTSVCGYSFTVDGPLVEDVSSIVRFRRHGDFRTVVRFCRRGIGCAVSVGLKHNSNLPANANNRLSIGRGLVVVICFVTDSISAGG